MHSDTNSVEETMLPEWSNEYFHEQIKRKPVAAEEAKNLIAGEQPRITSSELFGVTTSTPACI
jgi:hypothetical protein